MKKRLRLLAWMLTLTMLCELLPFGAFAQSDVGQQLALAAAQSLEEENGEAVASGSCGSYVKWSLSGDGTLTIYGRGAIYNYHPNENLCNLPPWWDYRESINTIILDSEISRIGDAAFYGCNIASIDIPDNIHSIGKWAFS
ncbi:MAG: leucine-rich repeat protein [Faecalibacterium prausnitzii]